MKVHTSLGIWISSSSFLNRNPIFDWYVVGEDQRENITKIYTKDWTTTSNNKDRVEVLITKRICVKFGEV